MTLTCRSTLAALLAVLLAASAAAGGEAVLEKKLSVDFKGATLKAALAEVQEKTGLRFAYSEERLARCAPVTFAAKDEPAARVLRRLLRPEGLELVQSREGLAAVVELASDPGAAKAFGRALRTGVRLLAKLEGARLEGEELRVPGWTVADDRDLAEGAIDLFDGALWLADLRQKGDDELAIVERLAGSYDPDVRAGAVVIAVDSGTVPGDARFRPVLEKLLSDPDPVARGCWLAMAPELLRGGQVNSVTEHICRAAEDERAELRFAAAIADVFLVDKWQAPVVSMEKRGNDGSAAVRYLGLISRFMAAHNARTPSAGLLAEQTVAALREKNPLFRAAMLATVLILSQDLGDRASRPKPQDQIQELAANAQIMADPLLSRMAMLAKGGTADLPAAAAAARDLALSDKEFHRRLGCAALAVMIPMHLGSQNRAARAKKEPAGQALDLGALPARTDDPDLVLRLTAIFANGALEGAEADGRLAAALRGDELSRHTALLACVMRKESWGRPLPGTLADAASSAVRRPGPSEAAIQMVLHNTGGPEYAKWAAAEIKKNPGSVISLTVARRGYYLANGQPGDPAPLLEAILDSGDSRLVTAFLKTGGHSLNRHPQLAVRLIREAPPEALPLLADARWWAGRDGKELAATFAARLRETAASRTPSHRQATLRALTRWADSSLSDQTEREALLAPAREMLPLALAAGGEEAVTAVELLSALCPSPFVFRSDERSLPDFVQAACVTALGLVENPDCGNAAVMLLCQLTDGRSRVASPGRGYYASRSADDGAPAGRKTFGPELVKAIEAATRAVLERGTLENRVRLRQAMADAGDAAAVRELAAMCIAGKVPAELREEAVLAAAHQTKLVPPEFIDWLLARATDPKESNTLRRNLFLVLPYSGYAAHRERLAAAALAVLGRQDDAAVMSAAVDALCAAAQAEKKANPAGRPWLAEAAALALRMIHDDKSGFGRTGGALMLLTHAAPDQAAPEVERLTLSGGPKERQVAAALLPEACPRTGVYAKLLGEYDKLDEQLRQALAESAARSLQAPQAEDFVIRALNDAKLSWKHGILNNIGAPATPKLLAALEALKNNKELGPYVKDCLRDLKSQGAKPPPPKRTDPPEVF